MTLLADIANLVWPLISRRAKLRADLDLLKAARDAGIDYWDMEDDIRGRLEYEFSPHGKRERERTWAALGQFVFFLVSILIGSNAYSAGHVALSVAAWCVVVTMCLVALNEFRLFMQPEPLSDYGEDCS